MKPSFWSAFAALLAAGPAAAGPDIRVAGAAGAGSLALAGPGGAAAIAVDPRDYPVVGLAAGLFADDVLRVTGERPAVTDRPRTRQAVIVGTLGRSALLGALAREGKLTDLSAVEGRWEATLWQLVDRPLPGVDRALVIAGSDRRGAAYGLMELSERIGVSPWIWWADAPVRRRSSVALSLSAPRTDAPAVRYRGIFINDEDWGLQPWAAKTFDPAFGNIGPKTYERVFELMLRLRLNTLWPAMHGCSAEFASQPDNARLADRFGIVAGSSHCEPMLYNNVNWNEKTRGRWDYTVNRRAIQAAWEESAESRGGYEAVWTLGIRGIHDRPMEGPSDPATRVRIVSEVIADQRALIDRWVTPAWGPVAQCFVPYKEVLPIYDSGLRVPGDVTLVWADDNFGYLRRLSSPAERERPGGAGVYWHISYYGGPHSYTWINTTAPAFMWEELHKAWDNDARRLWVLNVGDIKPMEVGVDFFARLAWRADALGPDAQPAFLSGFAAENLGPEAAPAAAALLAEYFRLGTIRKPELMDRAWAMSLSPERAAELEADYRNLLRREQAVAASLPAEARDAYFEMIGFPARVLGSAGLIFMADRRAQLGADPAANDAQIQRLRSELEAQVWSFNHATAGGKWRGIMPGLETGSNLMAWSSQVRWPWGEKGPWRGALPRPAPGSWRDAALFAGASACGPARWTVVPGLGRSGRAVALEPAGLQSSWAEGDARAPALTYGFEARGGDAAALIDFLPTFRICPGTKLRVAAEVDGRPASAVEVPGSDGQQDERGPLRQEAVQDNAVRVSVPLGELPAGRHLFTIRAIDPGVVIDRVCLP